MPAVSVPPHTSPNAAPAASGFDAHTGAGSSVASTSSKINVQDVDEEEGDDEDEDAEDETWDDWVDDEDGNAEDPSAQPTKALFGENVLKSPREVLEHAKSQGCDIVALIARLNLDFAQIIRLVNFIRATNPSPEAANRLDASDPVLNDDRYMSPVIRDDPLLQIDLEELALAHQPGTSSGHPAQQSIALQRRVHELEEALQLAQVQLASRQEAMDKIFQERYGTTGSSDSSSTSVASKSASEKGKSKDDAGYFDSYAMNEIHEIMLKDKVRTEAYRDFILNNETLFEGATVLDVGCGTGILSMFAAKAGAKKVFAVDASKVAFKAMRNVKENGLSDVVQVIHGKIEELDAQQIGQVDIIISEWMGYMLLYEAMLDSVIVARERFLRPGGIVAPSQCSIVLAAVQDEALYTDRVTYWQEVYGFKMTAMLEEVYREADVRILDASSVCSSAQTIKNVNIVTDTVRDCDFESEFKLEIVKSGTVHGFLGWFDTFFTKDGRAVAHQYDMSATPEAHEVYFSTGAHAKPTHWKQTFFLLKEPLRDVKVGDTISGTFSCRKDVEYARGLEVEIVFTHQGRSQQKAQVWLVS